MSPRCFQAGHGVRGTPNAVRMLRMLARLLCRCSEDAEDDSLAALQMQRGR